MKSKLIYMEQTLNLMAKKDIESVKTLVSNGVVMQTKSGNYLLIETNQKEKI